MWRCKECGREISLMATVPTKYCISLNKEGEISEFEDYVSTNWEDAEIEEYSCIKCDNYGDSIKDIAYWED